MVTIGPKVISIHIFKEMGYLGEITVQRNLGCLAGGLHSVSDTLNCYI